MAPEPVPVGLVPGAPIGIATLAAARVAATGEGGAGSHILVTPAVQQASAPSSRSKGNQASRHKNAEQRRRNRINERLDKLRVLIPHAEGTNIATFLDTVIEYVGKIQEISGVVPGKALPTRAEVTPVEAAPDKAAEPMAKMTSEPRPPTPEQSEDAGGTAAAAAAAKAAEAAVKAAEAAEAAAAAAIALPVPEASGAPAAKRVKVAALG